MKKSIENLNELLRRFAENSSADAMAEEIRRGDEILERYPSPVLSPQAAERIRHRLHAARRGHRRTVIFGWATVAAAVVGIMVFWIGLDSPDSSLAPSPNRPIARVQTRNAVRTLVPNLWDETLFAESEKSFAAINAELDSIAESIEAVRFKKSDTSQDCFPDGNDAERMENQLNSTNFWQG